MRAGRVIGSILAVGAVGALLVVPAATPIVPVAEAATTVFDPIPGATPLGSSAFGQVVTNGTGTFLEVGRSQSLLGQFTIVRRSTDGGRTWTARALLQGEPGGATRPHVSISGDFAAVTFIGSWCEPAAPNVCPEAPYLSVSTDAGQSWSTPRRLATAAFNVWVAQSGPRTWVVSEVGGDLDVRGTTDGGESWLDERRVTGSFVGIAADDSLGALAYLRSVQVGGEGRYEAMVLTLDALGVGTAPASLGGTGPDDVSPLGVAVADGRVTVVVRASVHGGSGEGRLMVRNGDSGGFGAAVPLAGGFPVPAFTRASIDATHDLVAVSALVDGTVLVSTSADGGRTFGPLSPVAIHPGASNARVGVARRASDRPTARFSWSVPPRLKDDDGDGFADPANWTGFAAADELRVAGGRDMAVAVDGCASTMPAGRTLASIRWSTVAPDGTLTPLPDVTCAITLPLRSGDVRTLRLDVTDSAGATSSTVQTVAPRNLVIASLGDSIASGEGNPHVAATDDQQAVWRDRSCHRSALAGPAVAALRMEVSDPHTSVTFIQLACSGAAMLDVPAEAGSDSVLTGGVLDQYQGQEPEPGSVRPAQLTQLADLLGSGASRRPVDALLLSIGANDAKFSDVVLGCIYPTSDPCNDPAGTVRPGFEQRLADLPRRYGLLAAAINDLGIAPAAVHITQYFDPTTDELGVAQLRCVDLADLIPLVDDDETAWARTAVIGGLHQAVEAAATTHGWRYVGGIADQFERHGYCSSDPWVVQIDESEERQGGRDGAFHPNLAGHIVYADAIHRSLRSALAAGVPSTPSTTPVPLGDLVVVSDDGRDLRATSVRDTGGVPTTLGIRRIDRVLSGDGLLGTFGPPAVDGFAAVAAWTTLPVLGQTQAQDFVAPIAIRPNAAVRVVSVVQAPSGGRLLVADRPSLVLAVVEAALDRNETVDVRTTVEATDTGGASRTVVDVTAPVQLRPGVNRLILPAGSTFTLADGEVVTATVRVTDPLGADLVDAVDNERSSDPAAEKTAVPSRALKVLFVRPGVAGGTAVGCNDLAGVAQVQVAFARAAMPVVSDGVQSSISCADLPAIPASEPALPGALVALDGVARTSGVDIVAAVVPKNWLRAFTSGAQGVTAKGMRAVIIEGGSASMTLAHEITHTFGADHPEIALPADGVRVDQRRWMEGTDWMAKQVPKKFWTAAGVWDAALSAIGPPANAAALPRPGSQQLTITGALEADGDPFPGPWHPGDTGSPRDLDDELELERVVARQVDGAGDELGSTEMEVGEAEPVGGDPDASYGSAYHGVITLLDDTAAVQVLVDQVVVETRAVGSAPTLEVKAPTDAVTVARGESLTVEWLSSRPDLPTDLYVSQDGGVTWKPLALGRDGTTAQVVVPADLQDGDTVVRAVQSDGVRMAIAESAAFTIGGGATVLPERIVAVRVDLIDLTVPGARLPSVPGNGLVTMAPDGTDLVTIVPTVAPAPGVDGFAPLRPDWSPDGRRVAFDALVAGRRDLYVVDRDGANLRRLTTAASSDGQQIMCADWKPDGTTLLAVRTTGLAANAVGSMELVVVDVASGSVTPLGWSTQNYFRSADAIGCPRWSPDGLEIYAEQETSSNPGSTNHDLYVLDAAALPPTSKYAYPPNNGAYQHGPTYASWIGVDPLGDDRFVTAESLFASTYLRVVQPTLVPLFIGDTVVPRLLPKIQQQVFAIYDNPDSPLGFARQTFGSVGFTPDGEELWATTNANLFPVRRVETSSCGFFCFIDRVVTYRVPHLCTMPVGRVVDPDNPPPGPAGTCYEAGGDGTPVSNLNDQASNLGAPLPDMPTIGVAMADWSPEIQVDGGGVDPVVVPDPSLVPADPPDPDPADVTEPLLAGLPAADADSVLPGNDLAGPVDGAVVLRAGETRVVQLPAVPGVTSPFGIVELPPATAVQAVPLDGDGWSTTGPDRLVALTAVAGFVGSTSLRFGIGADLATLTIEVVPDPAPTVVDDVITVPAGVPTVIPAALLLGNDDAGDLAALPRLIRLQGTEGTLRIVGVTGFAGGQARLLADGSVRVMADAAGTFVYTAANLSGITGSGRVSVAIAVEPTTTLPPTTTVPSTTAAVVPPAPTSQPTPVTSPPTTTFAGQIPSTGGGGVALVPTAVVVIAFGMVALAVARRHPRPRHRGGR